jgi:type I restriction enzyme M protein
VFSRPRLNPPEGKFTKIFGNPPFGDEVRSGDEDLLGENSLDAFAIAIGRDQIASEHVILERSIELLEPVENSRLGWCSRMGCSTTKVRRRTALVSAEC